MSEIINKVVTKHEITGQVKVTKVYPELENLTVTPTKTVQSFEHPGCYGYNNVVVKAIDCEPLSVVPQKENQTFDGMYDKVNVRAIDCETLNIIPKTQSQSFEGMYDKVNVDAIEADTLEVTPKKAEQSFTGLYKQVNVGAIKGDTLNVTPSKEQQVFNGLYETVNVDAMEVETLNITPTEETQTFNGLYETVNVDPINATEASVDVNFSKQDIVVVTPTEGEYLKKVTINKDEDLIPENIKSGVNIFGIDGTMEIGTDTSDATATAEDIASGKTAYVNGVKVEGIMEKQENPTQYITKCNSLFYGDTNITEITNFDCSSATSLAQMFQNCYKLEKVELKNISIATYAKQLCESCTNLKEFIFKGIVNIEDWSYSFNVCKNLERVIAPEGTKGIYMYATFCDCLKLVDIPMLDTSKNFEMAYAFANCPLLSDESLNKILLMCANTTSAYKTTKTLTYIGLSSSQREKCKTLSNYQAFLNAGWTA